MHFVDKEYISDKIVFIRILAILMLINKMNMIFGYNKEKGQITLMSQTSFKKHALLERKDFEKWIAENPEILGEDFLIITTEYDKFDKTNERLDLLALDKNGVLTIIELKRDDSGKNVDLQALKYAAFCSTLTYQDIINLKTEYHKSKGEIRLPEEIKEEILAFVEDDAFDEIGDKPRIVLVAGDFRPEVTSSVLWLRKFQLDITCIKIKLYELTNSQIILDSSIIIPQPETIDYMVRSERKENTKKSLTKIQTEYLDFFQMVSEKYKSATGNSPGRLQPRSYLQIPIGVSGVHFEWTFHGRPRSGFGVELHFEGRKENNQKAIEYLKTKENHISKEIGDMVNVQEQWGKNWSRIYIIKNAPLLTPDLADWAVVTMVKFLKVVMPIMNNYYSKRAH